MLSIGRSWFDDRAPLVTGINLTISLGLYAGASVAAHGAKPEQVQNDASSSIPLSHPYKAFLSYSHAADGKLAPAIQTGLHRFARPWYKLRAIRIFRDKTSLSASPALWGSIETALSESEFFLLLASPAAADSPWVQQEVAWWVAKHGASKMLILLTEGNVVWSAVANDFDWDRTTALPRNLCQHFSEEPLWVDFRWAKNAEHFTPRNSRFRSALLDVAAPLHGKPKEDLDGEDVRQYQRTRRLAWSAVTSLVLLTVAMAIAFIYAVQQKNIAEERRKIAVGRQLAAQAEVTRNAGPRLLPRSVLLATESLRRYQSFEATSTLRAGLQLLARPAFHVPVKGDLDSLAVSPDGKRLVTVVGGRKSLEVWTVPGGDRLGAVPLPSEVTYVAFSPDVSLAAVGRGKTLSAEGSPQSPVRIVDLTTCRIVLQIDDLPDVGPITFSSDGKYLVAISEGGWLNVLRLHPGPHFRFERARGGHFTVKGKDINGYANIEDVMFSPDSRYLLVTYDGGGAQVWEVPLLDEKLDGLKLVGSIERLSTWEQWKVSPDSKYLAVALYDNKSARIYELKTQKQVATMFHDDPVVAVSFSSDSKQVATASRDGTASIWDLSGRELRRIETNPESSAIDFAMGDKYLVASSADGVTFWDWRVNSSLNSVNFTYDDLLLGLVFGKEGTRLLAALETSVHDRSGHLTVMQNILFFHSEEPSYRNTFRLSEHDRWCAFSADGEMMVTEQKEGFTLWNISNEQPTRISVQRFPPGETWRGWEADRDVHISDDRRFLTAFRGGFLHIWHLPDGDLVRSIPLSELSYDLDFSRDGKLMIVASGDYNKSDKTHLPHIVQTWNLETGEKTAESSFAKPPYSGYFDFRLRVRMSSNGASCAVASTNVPHRDEPEEQKGRQNGIVYLFRCADLSQIAQLNHEQTVNEIVFSPHDKYLATSSDDGTASVWEASNGRPVVAIRHEGGNVRTAQFSTDEKYLMTGGSDRQAQIWKITTGKEVERTTIYRRTPSVIGSGITDVRFSNDGKWVASATDADIAWWLWQPQDLLELACSRVVRNLTREEWNRYLPDESPPHTCPNLR